MHSQPTQEQEQLCPAISRLRRGPVRNSSGLLAPNPRQGSALHPNRVKTAESCFENSFSSYAAGGNVRAF